MQLGVTSSELPTGGGVRGGGGGKHGQMLSMLKQALSGSLLEL